MQECNAVCTDPLTREEAKAKWIQLKDTAEQNIRRILKKMGLPDSLDDERAGSGLLGYMPTKKQVRRHLLDDVDLHIDILRTVETRFYDSASRGKVARDFVSGWLYRTTQRAVWRVATERAQQLMRELQPYDGSEVFAHVASTTPCPDDLLALRQFAERYAKVTASLSLRDRQLIDAKIAGEGYEALALKYGTTSKALKTRACRLWSTITNAVRGEVRSSSSRNQRCA